MLYRMNKFTSDMQYSYQVLAQQLRADIEAQRYQCGERLPSVRSTALAHGVSAATVVRCYRQLETVGLVEARSKSGMYVADWKARRTMRTVATTPPPVEYDKLVSLQHRMTELYSLTAQPQQLGLHLASAAPQWYPVEAMAKLGQRALRSQPALLGTYPTGTGLPALKDALILWLADAGVDLLPTDLLVTHGSTEALSVALRAVARAGDAVIVESPVYFGLLQMMENLGIKAIEVPCVPGTGLSMEALEYALEHQSGVRAVVVMPNFQNPLGCTMGEKAKRRLLKLAEQHDIAVIEDDVFGELSHTQVRSPPIKAWDRQGRVIYCGSCSKSVAPGLRLGWVAGGRYQPSLESLKLSNSLVTPLLEQAMLAAYLQSGALPLHLRKLRERLGANVPLALRAVAQYFPAGSEVISPAGGWWLWMALPMHIDTLVLLRRAVAQGIAFTPGSLFSNSSKYNHCLRLNIARPWGREMEQGLKKLGALAHQLA